MILETTSEIKYEIKKQKVVLPSEVDDDHDEEQAEEIVMPLDHHGQSEGASSSSNEMKVRNEMTP